MSLDRCWVKFNSTEGSSEGLSMVTNIIYVCVLAGCNKHFFTVMYNLASEGEEFWSTQEKYTSKNTTGKGPNVSDCKGILGISKVAGVLTK